MISDDKRMYVYIQTGRHHMHAHSKQDRTDLVGCIWQDKAALSKTHTHSHLSTKIKKQAWSRSKVTEMEQGTTSSGIHDPQTYENDFSLKTKISGRARHQARQKHKE